MKKVGMFLMLVFFGLGLVACGPSVTMKSAGGYEFYFVSRTGAAGHDFSGFFARPKCQVGLKVVTLEHSYTKSVTTWTNCSSKRPNRHAKNVHRQEVHKQWMEQRIIPQASTPAVDSKTYAYFGGNPSVGNSSLESAFIAGGMVGGAALLRPSRTVNNNNNSAAGGQGGKGGFGEGGAGGIGYGGSGGSANVSQSQDQSNWQDQGQSSDVNVKNEN